MLEVVLSNRFKKDLKLAARRGLPLDELIWELLLETGFYLAMGAMPSGSRRQANLRALVDKALAYQDSQDGSLYGFMEYIDAVKERKVSMGQVKMVGEDDDTIRIMTIHKSKGLEFPMVLLARTGVSGGALPRKLVSDEYHAECHSRQNPA